MKRLLFLSFVLLIIPLAMPFQLQAQQTGKINFGNFSIIPGISLQGVYDDNIYLGNGKNYPGDPQTTLAEKKVSDLVSHVKPSLLLSYLMPERGYISLGYQGDFAFYKDNNKNDWKNNQGNFLVNYQAPGGLIVGVDELFATVEDPYGGADQYQTGRITKRYYNDFKAKVGYVIMSNFRSFLYFNNYLQKYDNSTFDYSQDYTSNEYGIGAETRFLPMTWGFVRYHYGTRQYNTNAPGQTGEFNSDGKWHRVNAGLTWDPGFAAKLNGELNFGYQWNTYDHEFTSAARTARRDDKNSWIAGTLINYLPTEGTTITFNLSRAIRSTGSDTNEQFIDTMIGLNLQQKLLMKLTLIAGIAYTKNEYNVPVGNERNDNNYLANIGLDYKIQDWLTVGIGYKYNRKDSNVEIYEYVNNQVMAQVSIVY
jgi:hypothetical protein